MRRLRRGLRPRWRGNSRLVARRRWLAGARADRATEPIVNGEAEFEDGVAAGCFAGRSLLCEAACLPESAIDKCAERVHKPRILRRELT